MGGALGVDGLRGPPDGDLDLLDSPGDVLDGVCVAEDLRGLLDGVPGHLDSPHCVCSHTDAPGSVFEGGDLFGPPDGARDRLDFPRDVVLERASVPFLDFRAPRGGAPDHFQRLLFVVDGLGSVHGHDVGILPEQCQQKLDGPGKSDTSVRIARTEASVHHLGALDVLAVYDGRQGPGGLGFVVVHHQAADRCCVEVRCPVLVEAQSGVDWLYAERLPLFRLQQLEEDQVAAELVELV